MLVFFKALPSTHCSSQAQCELSFLCQWPLLWTLSPDLSWMPALKLSESETKLIIFSPNLWFSLHSLRSLIHFLHLFIPVSKHYEPWESSWTFSSHPIPPFLLSSLGSHQSSTGFLPWYLLTCFRFHFLSHCLRPFSLPAYIPAQPLSWLPCLSSLALTGAGVPFLKYRPWLKYKSVAFHGRPFMIWHSPAFLVWFPATLPHEPFLLAIQNSLCFLKHIMLFPLFIDSVTSRYILGTCEVLVMSQVLGKQWRMEDNEKLTHFLSQRAFLLVGRTDIHQYI